MEEIDIEKFREILGESAKQLNDDQLQDQCVMIKHLVETWLDEYEKSIFDGKTLRELLGGSL